MSVATVEHVPAVGGRRERRAVGWLTVGLLLGPIGLCVGWYHVLTAPRWPWRDKIMAAVLPVPLAIISIIGRAELDAETCRQSADGSIACATHATWTIAAWAVPVVMLILLALMIRHLNRSARSSDTHPVTSTTAAVVLALVAAWAAPMLVDRAEDTWSYGERDAVVGAAADADAAGEAYAVVDEQTQSDWASDSGARPTEDEMDRLVGVGNRRFDLLFEELAAERWDEDGAPSISDADRGTCHVFPVVPSGDPDDVQDVTALARLCYGPAEWTSVISLDDGY
ncbi:hypothetical protein [Aeromicrobium fastidiosum]|uniref:Uncharacterized protein n=1 Tax=Aeromicrobium fastidiosum TaxID=52699 RepID=A0A641ANS4_9ACTN|nr:hypothetical protein [Aeromicrobium fastidiosum]KAA1376452.1 hypothetical protein ESP62_013580 [Aeromicrobium fastidiosum]MBP2391633.1 hypothetical protein [Aeromicrobium fastidiosum]